MYDYQPSAVAAVEYGVFWNEMGSMRGMTMSDIPCFAE